MVLRKISSFRAIDLKDTASRLGQIYLVDQMSRAIDMRLDHLRKNQAHILGGGSLDSGIADNSDDEHYSDVQQRLARI